MEVTSSLSLLSQRHVEHCPEWMVIGTSSRHGLLCLACAVELLEDSEVPNMKKKFLLGEMGSSFKDSSGVTVEFLLNHEEFTWYLVDILFNIVQQNNEHLTEIASEVLLQVCCQLQSDGLVYGLLQKILNKIEASSDSQQCLSILSLMSKMIDAIPALSQTLVEDNVDLLSFLTQEISSPDEAVSCLVITLLSSLLGSSPPASSPRTVVAEICGRLFRAITAAQSPKILHGAVGLLRLLTEVPDYIPCVVETAFSTGQHTLPSVIKKVLHTRNENLQISAVQIIGQLLSKSSDLQDLAEKLLDADIAEFLVERLSTTNQVLLSSIFCSLLLLTESDKYFSKCHSVLGIDPILRATEQCLAMNYFDALLYGLQLLSVIFEKHPGDQKLMSGADIFKHSTVLLTRCMKLSDSKLLLLGMRCLRSLFRKNYLPVPIDFSCLILPLNAAVGVISQFPRPLVRRGVKRHLTQRSEGEVRPSVNPKLAKQEEAILCCVQLVEKALSLAQAITDDTSLYDESQFGAPSAIESHDDGPHGNSLSSYTTHLLGTLERDVIPTVMINYDIFSESSAPLFTSFLRTLCHCCGMDVTVDFHEKLVSSSFLQWALEVKSKFYSESTLRLAVDEFIPSLCSKLLSSSSPHPVSTSSLKAAMHHTRDAMSLCKLLTEDPEAVDFHGPNNQSEASILEIQEGSLAILYCAWLHEDRLVSETSLLEVLAVYMTHRSHSRPSDTALKHLLFLFASVCHSGDIPIQMEGTTALLRVMGEAHGRAIYTHHHQIIEWCYTCPGVTSKFASEMLELWIHSIELPGDCCEETGAESVDVTFSVKFLLSNQKCMSSLLNLFITVRTKGIISKIIRLLERAFHNASKNQSDILHLMEIIFERLPEMQGKVLSSEGRIDSTASTTGLISFLRLVITVYTHCTEALQVNSSDLKLIFHVMKLLAAPESGTAAPTIPPEQTLVLLNYLTIVLLQSLTTGDSRVASVMLSSEPLLGCLDRMIATDQRSRLNALYTTEKKIRHQSIYVIAQLVKSCAVFKLKPTILLQLEVDVILRSLMDKDLCVKVIGLQLLTVLLDVQFESPLVQVTEGPRGGLRLDEDVGLGISARSLRRVFFVLQNILLQGSDFLAWNGTLCMASLLKYVGEKNKQLYSHLILQPWNRFLLQCCLNFYQDTAPSAWLLQLLRLIPSKVAPKSLGRLLQSAVQQDVSGTQDHIAMAAILNLISEERDGITWSQTLTDAKKAWLENTRASLQESPPTGQLIEILQVNDMVISADMASANETAIAGSMLRQAEKLLDEIS